MNEQMKKAIHLYRKNVLDGKGKGCDKEVAQVEAFVLAVQSYNPSTGKRFSLSGVDDSAKLQWKNYLLEMVGVNLVHDDYKTEIILNIIRHKDEFHAPAVARNALSFVKKSVKKSSASDSETSAFPTILSKIVKDYSDVIECIIQMNSSKDLHDEAHDSGLRTSLDQSVPYVVDVVPPTDFAGRDENDLKEIAESSDVVPEPKSAGKETLSADKNSAEMPLLEIPISAPPTHQPRPPKNRFTFVLNEKTINFDTIPDGFELGSSFSDSDIKVLKLKMGYEYNISAKKAELKSGWTLDADDGAKPPAPKSPPVAKSFNSESKLKKQYELEFSAASDEVSQKVVPRPPLQKIYIFTTDSGNKRTFKNIFPKGFRVDETSRDPSTLKLDVGYEYDTSTEQAKLQQDWRFVNGIPTPPAPTIDRRPLVATQGLPKPDELTVEKKITPPPPPPVAFTYTHNEVRINFSSFPEGFEPKETDSKELRLIEGYEFEEGKAKLRSGWTLVDGVPTKPAPPALSAKSAPMAENGPPSVVSSNAQTPIGSQSPHSNLIERIKSFIAKNNYKDQSEYTFRSIKASKKKFLDALTQKLNDNPTKSPSACLEELKTAEPKLYKKAISGIFSHKTHDFLKEIARNTLVPEVTQPVATLPTEHESTQNVLSSLLANSVDALPSSYDAIPALVVNATSDMTKRIPSVEDHPKVAVESGNALQLDRQVSFDTSSANSKPAHNAKRMSMVDALKTELISSAASRQHSEGDGHMVPVSLIKTKEGGMVESLVKSGVFARAVEKNQTNKQKIASLKHELANLESKIADNLNSQEVLTTAISENEPKGEVITETTNPQALLKLKEKHQQMQSEKKQKTDELNRLKIRVAVDGDDSASESDDEGWNNVLDYSSIK